MATDNSMGDSRLAPLNLPEAQTEILRRELSGWIASLDEDLEEPELLTNPEQARAEASACRRMLGALGKGTIAVPDEEAHGFLREAAETYDKESDYGQIVATHDAMRGLLAALGGER